MNVLLFKFRCNVFIGVRIIKEMPGSVASGTFYTVRHVAKDEIFPTGIKEKGLACVSG
jgi:hypothetical protein